ncbi:MAG: ATP phosphoribosyltransferase regulatory subunit [Deinococcales bacterium]
MKPSAPPDGTRFVQPAAARARAEAVSRLHELYRLWGYEPVEVPALERYDPGHPRSEQSFKLSDRDSGVLALRSDFTPALAHLVGARFPEAAAGAGFPLRLRYSGTVWHAIDSELARTREFTQIGIELIGVSHARADAELIHLARESVRTVGLVPRVEIGNPGFVRALFDVARVPAARREALADALDRKDRSDIARMVAELGVSGGVATALLEAPDLYGGGNVLGEARRLAPWAETRAEIDRLEGVVEQFEDDSELLLDLGMARRLAYYTGVTFRAYTFDFGQPLLGGGRYDGALLPHAAGFSIGLERLMAAMPAAPDASGPQVLATDDAAARRLRAAGVAVLRASSADEAAAAQEARVRGVPYLLHDGDLRAVAGADAAVPATLLEVLAGTAGEGGSGHG